MLVLFVSDLVFRGFLKVNISLSERSEVEQ
jgi:hypothetical protein